MDLKNDVIAGLATPPGRGGVGVIRVSGPDLSELAAGFLGQRTSLKPRHAHYLPFFADDRSVIDQGLVIHFVSPDSFTGEDVLELQGHGGMVVMDMLLERAVELGARLANPGEFTERAFLNGKIDLAQAEAIADLISAASRKAARSAVQSMQGTFSSRIDAISAKIIELRAWIEAEMDFSDEEIDLLSATKIGQRIEEIRTALLALLKEADQGRVLNEGLKVVIAGRPNAGKSSLLNALSGIETAIVTDIPGTTRDVLKEKILVDGMPVHIIDTAGLRDTQDQIEREGVRRARSEIAQADRILLVVDAALGDPDSASAISECIAELGLPQGELPPVTVILNKSDVSGMSSGERIAEQMPTYALSAKTGEGIEALRRHIKCCAGFDEGNDGGFIARRRHVEAIRGSIDHLVSAADFSSNASQSDLLAEELRLAHDRLGEITGKVLADDLLGKIFSEFCIGK